MKKISHFPFSLHNNVEKHRLQIGFSISALSYKVGISRSNLTRIEQGKIIPSVLTALKLADFLHVKVETLFNFKKYIEVPEKDEFEIEMQKGLEKAGLWDLYKDNF